MVKTDVKVLAAISYVSWLFYLISFLIYRSSQQENQDFYYLHSVRAFTLNLIGTFSSIVGMFIGIAGSRGVVIPISGLNSFGFLGFFNLALFVFVIWGIAYAIMGRYDRIPALDDLIAMVRK